jgi:tRNA threonylcarbamoyladenosine modification (KEOPS) complex Cgi121 subunit
MEVLLYLSGQRQIKIALEEFGMKANDDICIIILGNSEEPMKEALSKCKQLVGGISTDEVMMISDENKFQAIREYFQIGEEELNAVSHSATTNSQEAALLKLVLNRIALVVLDK